MTWRTRLNPTGRKRDFRQSRLLMLTNINRVEMRTRSDRDTDTDPLIVLPEKSQVVESLALQRGARFGEMSAIGGHDVGAEP